MKYILLALMCFPPFAAEAAMLADCDKASYEVTVSNGGASRVVTLSPAGGVIREFGPMVSFKLKDQPAIVIHEPDEEYCIWSGKIVLQRISSVGSSISSNSLR